VDYLIRNSITLPDVCVGETNAPVWTTTDTLSLTTRTCPTDANITGSLGCDWHELRTNTRDQTDGRFQRTLVKIEPNDPDPALEATGSVTIFQPPASTAATPATQHGGVSFETDPYKMYLTFSTGAVGATNFLVNDLTFKCTLNRFTGGYVVKTSFFLTYNRPTLGQVLTDDYLQEYFERETAVRANAPFEF
jgi:hypothetical protein